MFIRRRPFNVDNFLLLMIPSIGMTLVVMSIAVAVVTLGTIAPTLVPTVAPPAAVAVPEPNQAPRQRETIRPILSPPTVLTPAVLATPETNPVPGMATDLVFSWKRPSLLPTAYRLEAALDKDFIQVVVVSNPVSDLDPVVVRIGRQQLVEFSFSPGTTYYWRVKATAPIESPWSTVRSFAFTSLEPPFALVFPKVGEANVAIKPILTWTTYKGALWYELTVSEDPSFAISQFSHNVNNLFYGVAEPLKYNTTYYWRVRAVNPSNVSAWTTGDFTTMAKPEDEAKAEPAVIIQPGEVKVVQVPVERVVVTPTPIPSYLLWLIIGIGALLIIILIILIVRTRRVA